MSVGLLLEHPNTQQQSRLVPIATEQIFQSYWLPASKILGLQWIRLFQSGLTIEPENRLAILVELELLKQFMISKPQPLLPNGIVTHIVERINLLVAELKILEPGVEAYIG